MWRARRVLERLVHGRTTSYVDLASDRIERGESTHLEISTSRNPGDPDSFDVERKR
jgi:hypothetical protein